MKKAVVCVGLIALLGIQAVKAQKKEFKEEIKKELSFTDKNAKNTLIVKNIFGSITVEGYDGDEVQFEVEKTITAKNEANLALGKEELVLKVVQEGNTMIAHPDAPYLNFNYKNGDLRFNWCDEWEEPPYQHHMDFKVKVPKNSNVEVSTINDGEVVIKNTAGAFIKANNINGGIELANVTGQTDVHAINGKVDISYVDNPTKSSTYFSLNGDINITYQKDLSADIAFKSMNGEMFTDFDIAKQFNRTSKNNTENNGKGKYKYESKLIVQIGEGGIDHDFKTLNGNVFIKKI